MNSQPNYQPYAPSPYSYTPNPTTSASISLDEEVKLSTTAAQRELNESLSDIFSIIIALDFLEKAFVRDSIKQEEYTQTCLRLLGHYKHILKTPAVAQAFGSLDKFKQKYDVSLLV